MAKVVIYSLASSTQFRNPNEESFFPHNSYIHIM